MANNIKLRPLQEKDAPYMLEWMTDPAITRFFRFDAAEMSLEKCLAFICGAGEQQDCRHYAIVNEADEYLGTISLKEIAGGSAEYAISTRACAHGTGAAMAATQMLLSIAFGELGLRRVYLNVLEENGRANAFYQKAGFHFTHKEENALVLRGASKNLNWYEIKKEAYYG